MSRPPSPTPASNVTLPRWVLGLLVGACAAGLLGVTYLLGRASAPPPPAAPATVETAGQATAGPATAAVAPESERAVPTTELPADGLAGAQAAAPPFAAPSSGGGPDAGPVAAYFAQMDAIGAEAKVGQDPQALARKIVEQTISGNTGAMEGLIATQRALEARLGRIQPPPACREHHERSLRLFGRAIVLLEHTRDALSGQGTTDLGNVASEGRAIEQEAKALDALANDIRRSVGLAPIAEPAS